MHLEESRTKFSAKQQNSCGCSLEERIPLLTSAKVSIAVSVAVSVWFLDIIFSVVIVAFVVVVLILNTRGGAHVARIVHYFFLPPFDSKFPFRFTCCALLIILPCFEGTNLMRNYYVKSCNLLPARRTKHVARSFKFPLNPSNTFVVI